MRECCGIFRPGEPIGSPPSRVPWLVDRLGDAGLVAVLVHEIVVAVPEVLRDSSAVPELVHYAPFEVGFTGAKASPA